METMQTFYDGVRSLLPTAGTVVVVALIIIIARMILSRWHAGKTESRFRSQIVTLSLSLAGILVVILVLPIGDTRQGHLLSLIGILLSAAIALSSTTFVGNAMAGMMIRALRNFRVGEFILIGDHFGRVTERGLFHTEIQTEDRDLTTLPNMFLVTNPVKVVQSSGTIVSATVSLGYEISRSKIEPALIEAAQAAALQEPFVHIMELGDFSVTYRVAGLLPDVKHLLTVRSNLREQMLDALHRDGIEIVSPTFMNTRAFQSSQTFIPGQVAPRAAADIEAKATPEDLLFDKADEAESLEKLRERYETLGKDIEETKNQMKQTVNEQQRAALKARIDRIETSREHLREVIKRREEEKTDQ